MKTASENPPLNMNGRVWACALCGVVKGDEHFPRCKYNGKVKESKCVLLVPEFAFRNEKEGV